MSLAKATKDQSSGVGVNPATRIQGWLIVVAIPCTAIVFSFHFVSFLHVKELVFSVSVAILAVLALFGGATGQAAHRWLVPVWLLMVFSLLRPLLLPVEVPSDVIVEISRWVLTLIAAGIASELATHEIWRKRLEHGLMLSAFLVSAMGLVQLSGYAPSVFPHFEGYTQPVYSVFGNQDLLGGYLAVCLPLAICRLLARAENSKQSPLCEGMLWLSTGVMLLGLLVSGCRSAWLAGAVGVVLVIAMTRVSRRRLAAVLGVAAAIAVTTLVSAPALTLDRVWKTLGEKDEGFHARICLWRAAARMAQDSPVVGVGVGNYAYWSPRYLGEITRDYADSAGFDLERQADHPHSDPLKILAETGLVGLACCAWMIWRLAKCRGPEWGGIAAWLVFAAMNGPLQSIPHIVAGLLLVVLLKGSTDNRGELHSGARAILVLITLVVVCVEIGAVVIPSYRLRTAENSQLVGKPCLDLYRNCVEYPWPNARAHRDYGLALAEVGQDGPAREELQSALSGMDTGDIYLALGVVSLRLGLAEEARRWARECLVRWPHSKDAAALLGQPRGIE